MNHPDNFLTPSNEERLREVVRHLAKALDWVRCDDDQVTCVVCNKTACDVETRISVNGATSWSGAHSACLKGDH